MLPLSISMRYTDSFDKSRTRTLAGVRKDLNDEQIKDFAYNSAKLMGYVNITSAVLTTRRSLV